MKCPNYVDPDICAILLANQENLERSRKYSVPSTFRQMLARNFHRRRKR